MAETAGLVLGAITLVGVFQDCILLFSEITAARSLGRDYEILNAKLDIEKTLLLQWADRVALLNPVYYDKRLDDLAITPIIERALAAIRLLLSESTDLQNRYGVRPAEQNESTDVSPVMSGRLMSRFYQESASLKLQIKAHGDDKSLFRKVRWVVKDKEKFESLIQDLSHFINRLNAIVPDRRNAAHSPLSEEIRGLRSVRNLQLVLKTSIDYEMNLTEVTREVITRECTRDILELLWFRRIDERKDNVAQAHLRTLEWSLHPPTSDVPWDDLCEWLQSGSGVYWVSGKAGSGKSTLMKFLFHNRQVENLLGKWSDNRNLITSCFFLWNLGTSEQKSHEGLARGLLYHVLNANKSLIPLVLPRMWREAQKAEKALGLPSRIEMEEAFSRLGTEYTDGAYCFFIDGLDEYSGNYRDGISFINKLVVSSNIKALVSSRPIDLCVEAFSSMPKLALQDLTEKDIELYITDTVRSHPYMDELMKIDSIKTENSLLNLREKASGVFLWVVLACQSLLEGFAACDYPNDLQQRINELPPELEDLFKHMLNKIPSRYRIQAARLLRICYQGRLLEVSESIPTLGLALIDEKQMDIHTIPEFCQLTSDRKRAICEKLEGRLRSRCCGLLEVHRAKKFPPTCFCGNKAQHDGIIDSSVDFMHRTVFEFMTSYNVWVMDHLEVTDDGFDATAILSCMTSYSIYFQEDEKQMEGSDDSCELARQNLIYAKRIDDSGSESVVSVSLHLGEAFLKRSIASYSQLSPFFCIAQEISQPGHVALLLAVEANMINFVQRCETLERFISVKRPQ